MLDTGVLPSVTHSHAEAPLADQSGNLGPEHPQGHCKDGWSTGPPRLSTAGSALLASPGPAETLLRVSPLLLARPQNLEAPNLKQAYSKVWKVSEEPTRWLHPCLGWNGQGSRWAELWGQLGSAMNSGSISLQHLSFPVYPLPQTPFQAATMIPKPFPETRH